MRPDRPRGDGAGTAEDTAAQRTRSKTRSRQQNERRASKRTSAAVERTVDERVDDGPPETSYDDEATTVAIRGPSSPSSVTTVRPSEAVEDAGPSRRTGGTTTQPEASGGAGTTYGRDNTESGKGTAQAGGCNKRFAPAVKLCSYDGVSVPLETF